ncbi:MAG: hypothetical protein M3071_24660 [Actinomycetota bacterium]|nr:hypothetical protein [Actinomycetota bacterium]
MGTRDWIMSRARAFDLVVIDRALAGLLTVGILVDAALLSHPRLSVLAIVSCVVPTASVAWRRRYPALATLVAVTAQFGFLTVGQRDVLNGAPVAIAGAALLLDFYLLGRRATGRRDLLIAGALLAYTLGMFAVISGSASVSDVLLEWVPLVALFAVARTLASRRALTRELAATAARLREEQERRARQVRITRTLGARRPRRPSARRRLARRAPRRGTARRVAARAGADRLPARAGGPHQRD